MKFTVYEIWTRTTVVEAPSEDTVYALFEPRHDMERLGLCDYYAVSHDDPVSSVFETAALPAKPSLLVVRP